MSNKRITAKRSAVQQQAKKDRRAAKHAIDKQLRQALPKHLNTSKTRRTVIDNLGGRLKIRRQKQVDGVTHHSYDGGITWAPAAVEEGGAA